MENNKKPGKLKLIKKQRGPGNPVTKENRVRLALHQSTLYHKLIITTAFLDGVSAAGASKKILKNFFDSLPKARVAHLLIVWDTMTAEQRKFPNRQRG